MRTTCHSAHFLAAAVATHTRMHVRTHSHTLLELKPPLPHSHPGLPPTVCPFMLYGELAQRLRLATGGKLRKWPTKAMERWGGWFLFSLFAAILVWEEASADFGSFYFIGLEEAGSGAGAGWCGGGALHAWGSSAASTAAGGPLLFSTLPKTHGARFDA